MKRFYCLMALLCHYLGSYAQTDYSDYSLQEDFDRYFSHVDLHRTHTGYLYDKALPFFDLKYISADRLDDSSLVASHHLPFIYSTLLMAGTGDNHALPDRDSLYGYTYGNLTPANVIPLSLVAWRYDYLRADALSIGAMHIQDSMLYDGPNTYIDPYQVDTAFAMLPQIFRLDRTDLRFCIYSSSAMSNLSYPFDSVRIDFGDGQGWRWIQKDQLVHVHYGTDGTKTILTETALPGGHTLRSHAAIDIVLPAPPAQNNPPPDPPATYDIGHPDIIGMTADKIYLDRYGSCELNIFYACDDRKIRKPFILVDGFDPTPHGNNVTYKDIFYENKLGIRKDQLPLNFDRGYDALFAEGYDLVFVDWVDKYDWTYVLPHYLQNIVGYDTIAIRDPSQRPGNDFIQRNAFVVEKVVKWANAEKHKNNSSAPSVIAGMSMGGAITKYAVLDLEEEGYEHELENVFTFDSPLQGASMFMGLQHFIRWLNDLVIGYKDGIRYKLGDVTAISDFKNVITSPAARQMLIRQAYPDVSLYENFYAELNSKGLHGDGSFAHTTHRAISNASIQSTGQLYGEHAKLLDMNIGTTWNPTLSKVKAIDGFIQLSQIIAVLYFNLSHVQMKVGGYAMRQNDDKVFDGKFKHVILGNIMPTQKRTVNAGGGFYAEHMPGSFTSLGKRQLGEFGIDVVEASMFMPIWTTLPVRAPERNDLWRNYTNRQAIVDNEITTAESYEGSTYTIKSFEVRERKDGSLETDDYMSQENQLHVMTTYNNITYLFYEVLKTRYIGGINLSQRFNFGKSNREYPNYNKDSFSCRSIDNQISGQNTVPNGGLLGVNLSGTVGYNNSGLTNQHNYHYTAYLTNGGCGGTSAYLTINSGGELRIGTWDVHNSGTVSVDSACTLDVYGKLQIDTVSRVIIRKGGRLILRTGANIQLPGGRIIIEKGGELLVENAVAFNFRKRSGIYIDGIANFGSLNIEKMDGLVSIMSHGICNFHGNTVLQGVDRDKDIIRLSAGTKITVDSVNLTFRSGRITGSTAPSYGIVFNPNAKNILLDNVSFIHGFAVDAVYGFTGLSILNSYFEGVERAVYVTKINDQTSTAAVNVENSTFKNCKSSFRITGVNKVNFLSSEIYGTSQTWEEINGSVHIGITLNNIDELYLDRTFIAKQQNGIRNNDQTYIKMNCSYLINNVYGLLSYTETANTFEMIQSGLIHNKLGAYVSNTNLKVNTPPNNIGAGNIFVHCCDSTRYFIPAKYRKTYETGWGGVSSPGPQSIPPGNLVPLCQYIFEGTVNNALINNLWINAKWNFWFLNNGHCNIENLEKFNQPTVHAYLETIPEDSGPLRNISTCLVVNPPPAPLPVTQGSTSSVSIIPNPASSTVTVVGQSETGISRVEFFNSLGYRIKSAGSDGDINVSDLTAGVYIVRIFDKYNKIIATQRMVILAQ